MDSLPHHMHGQEQRGYTHYMQGGPGPYPSIHMGQGMPPQQGMPQNMNMMNRSTHQNRGGLSHIPNNGQSMGIDPYIQDGSAMGGVPLGGSGSSGGGIPHMYGGVGGAMGINMPNMYGLPNQLGSNQNFQFGSNDFPALGSGADSNAGGVDYVRMASDPMNQKEFSMMNEDFPALPGAAPSKMI